MADTEMEIIIRKDGTVEIDMIGYKGTACDLELRKLAKNIGVIVGNQKKQDYYKDDPNVHITE